MFEHIIKKILKSNGIQLAQFPESDVDIFVRLQNALRTTHNLPDGQDMSDFEACGYDSEARSILADLGAIRIRRDGLAVTLTLSGEKSQQIKGSDVTIIERPPLTATLESDPNLVKLNDIGNLFGQHQGMEANITEFDMTKRTDGNNNVHVHIESGWFSSDENAVVDRNGNAVHSLDGIGAVVSLILRFQDAAKKEKKERARRLKKSQK